MSGYLYVLSNESMPGIVKIGMTTRSAEARAEELYKSNTSVPTPFTVEFSVSVDDPAEAEENVHENLAEYRVNGSREFFKVDVDYAVQAVVEQSISGWELYAMDCMEFEAAAQVNITASRLGVHFMDVVSMLRHVSDSAWEMAALKERKAREEYSANKAKKLTIVQG